MGWIRLRPSVCQHSQSWGTRIGEGGQVDRIEGRNLCWGTKTQRMMHSWAWTGTFVKALGEKTYSGIPWRVGYVFSLPGAGWRCLFLTREYTGDERPCLAVLTGKYKSISVTLASVYLSKEFMIVPLSTHGSHGAGVFLAGNGACVEENLGAKWWIFSGWGGTVSGRIDAFPPEERMQRRDLQLEEADVYWSTYQSIWTLCTSTCESLRRTWLPLCSTPAGIEPRENIRQTPNEEYTLKKQWGTVFLNVMVIKIKISCSDITNKCST